MKGSRVALLILGAAGLMACSESLVWSIAIVVPRPVQMSREVYPQQVLVRYEAQDLFHTAGVDRVGVLCAPQSIPFVVFKEIAVPNTGEANAGERGKATVEAWLAPLESAEPCEMQDSVRVRMDGTLRPRPGEPRGSVTFPVEHSGQEFSRSNEAVLTIEQVSP